MYTDTDPTGRPASRTCTPALPCCHLQLSAQKPTDPTLPRYPQTLGEHLRRRRRLLGLFQREVATWIGVDALTVLNWERGKVVPQVHHLPRIHGFLGYCLWRPAEYPGDVLRQAREALGLSQERFGALVAADPGTVCRWEGGGRRVPPALISWLADPTERIPRAGRSYWRRPRIRMHDLSPASKGPT
ncbi:MAG: helix-turn-helix domain-containing protein [Deltaproteobacteria bacterium]|nr:MAG: helix-turn-helix domain-containing protein [Deltaproteobacteria bacterium]